jgi:uncharacterized protein (DUF2164 family)
MDKVQRGLDMLSEKDRDRCIKDIVSFFHDERNETIGVIAAENILDFFLGTIGPNVYNKAIEDVKILLKKKLEGWEFELDLLQRQK